MFYVPQQSTVGNTTSLKYLSQMKKKYHNLATEIENDYTKGKLDQNTLSEEL